LGVKVTARIRKLVVLALLLIAGCTDRYEASFATYADAKSRGALERGGWLPDFLPESATEIREEHDIDSNELWVTFSFGREFRPPASCSPSVQRAALDDQAPHGAFFSITPFFTLMGVLAAFGMDSLKWNDQPVLGLKALVAGPFMGLFAAALFTALIGLMLSLGLWLYSKFRPLSIRVLLEGTDAAATAP
jgi:hypothetical protein